MAEPISEITIVGGGTAGWLAALLLQTLIRDPKRSRKPIDITLIESPNVATVGVGEATVPGMPRTLREAGLSERDFFKRCNASFKLGVMFNGWNGMERVHEADRLTLRIGVPAVEHHAELERSVATFEEVAL